MRGEMASRGTGVMYSRFRQMNVGWEASSRYLNLVLDLVACKVDDAQRSPKSRPRPQGKAIGFGPRGLAEFRLVEWCFQRLKLAARGKS
jgi:hypothetical protein